MTCSRTIVGLACLLAGTVSAIGDEATERFFDGLRERRLFGLAEGYCLDRMGSERLDPEQRTEFVIELSRTLAEHGRYVPDGDERDGLWSRATGVLDEALAAKPPPTPTQRLRLELQRALVPAGLGEFLGRQVEVEPFNAALRERAATLMDDALARLAALQRRLDNPTDDGTDAPSTATVRAIEYNVRLRTAVTELDRAALLNRDDPNRVALLDRAADTFQSLTGGDPSDETTQRCHVFLARAWRMQGRAADAVRPLDKLLSGDERLATNVRDEVEAERAMITLVLGRPDETAKYLLEYGRARGRLPGELRFLLARALIGLWQAARRLERPMIADDALERLRNHVAATEAEVGGYWGMRCRVLLENAVAADEYGAELAHVIREADGRFHAGRTDDAIDGYAEAVRLATERDRPELVFQLGFTRGSMLLDADRPSEAADQFASLVERFPQHERAAKADLLAAYSLGRAYDAERTADARERYAAALEGHRARFPQSPTAGEAAWMLGRLHERRLQYTDALTAYLAIPAGHARGPVAAARAAAMFETIISLLEARNQPTDEWVASARTQLGRIVRGFPSAVEPLGLEQADVAIVLAKLQIGTEPRDYETADRLLERVATTWGAIERDLPEDERAIWREVAREAVQLRIVAMAGRGEIDGASRMITQLAGADASTLLEVLDGLTAVLSTEDGQLARQLGRLQLAAAARLDEQRDQLDATSRRRLDVCLAEGYLATDQSKHAVEVYERLLDEHPDDANLKRTIARRLTDCGRPECVRVAKPLWREFERKARVGTPEWFGHRYHVAWCALELGKLDECKQLLGVTRALHPDLGGPAWTAKFEELERRLRLATE